MPSLRSADDPGVASRTGVTSSRSGTSRRQRDVHQLTGPVLSKRLEVTARPRWWQQLRHASPDLVQPTGVSIASDSLSDSPRQRFQPVLNIARDRRDRMTSRAARSTSADRATNVARARGQDHRAKISCEVMRARSAPSNHSRPSRSPPACSSRGSSFWVDDRDVESCSATPPP